MSVSVSVSAYVCVCLPVHVYYNLQPLYDISVVRKLGGSGRIGGFFEVGARPG